MTQPKKLTPITKASKITNFHGFHPHPELEGRHAFLSPSSHSWQRYTKEHLLQVFDNFRMKERGTRIHAFVSEAIKLHIRAEDNNNSINQFINDAIGFRMDSEVPLYYSNFVFGTADAIAFDEEAQILRIHDLKTGVGPVKTFEQLNAYAALFMLEYGYAPQDIEIIERLYQNGGTLENIPDPQEIADLMSTIIDFTNALKEG